MTTKVYRGWLQKNVVAEPLHWVPAPAFRSPFLDILKWRKVWRYKHEENSWNPDAWPPKRVTITVEIED